MPTNESRDPHENPAASPDPRLSRRALLRRCLALPAAALLAACGSVAPAAPPAANAPTAAAATPRPTGSTLMPVVAKPTNQPTPAPSATPAPTPATVRFAVIGDYGTESEAEAAVASLIAGWGVEFIVTVGDNNYPVGAADTIDPHVGQFYHAFMNPYKGSYGAGADRQRFFASLGNHDWASDEARPALEFFSMPARYYTFTWGPAQFFMLDSDTNEPDGTQADSKQALWLRDALAASAARWKIVAFHHPPFSSGTHGPNTRMQWPFEEWGAHVVLSGHDHTYERIHLGRVRYFVNGLGGASRYAPGATPAEGSQLFYNANHGAMLVALDEGKIDFQFISIAGEVVDHYVLQRAP